MNFGETHLNDSRLSTVSVMNVWNGKILVVWGHGGGGQALAEEMGSGEENWSRAQEGMFILSRGMELRVCEQVGREWRQE